MWENLGAACVIEHKRSLRPRRTHPRLGSRRLGRFSRNRPGYDRPGNVISGMLLGYRAGAAKTRSRPSRPKASFEIRSNTVPAYFAGCIDGSCDGNGTIRTERALTHTVRSPFFTGPLRSPLRIQNTFANECFMDELCAQAKADPVAFRLRHLKTNASSACSKQPQQRQNGRHAPIRRRPSKHRIVTGRGIACVDYEGGNGYAALVAQVEVNRGNRPGPPDQLRRRRGLRACFESRRAQESD